ncbi:MAG: phage minor head protein [Draconibacterium sp.]
MRRFITGSIELSDDYSINISQLVNEALKEIYGGDTQPVNPRLFDITNNAIQNAFSVEFDTNGWGQGNPEFVDEFRTNGAVFAAFKNHQQTKDIVALLTDENGNQRSFYEFKKLALQVSEDYNVRYLQTEYNTATRSARAAINFRNYLKNEKVYPNLEYLESMASHKREAHLHYVGTVLPIRHAWWDTHMPPSGWNCQCRVRPSRKQPTEVPTDELVPPVFANNPGSSAKFIKTEETPYYKNTDADLRQQIEDLAKRAERIRQQLEELELKRRVFKSGGYIDVPKTGQNKNEEKENLSVYGLLAKKYGEKYALVTPDNASGMKTPDAVNLKKYVYSDLKTQTIGSVKNVIQNGTKEASKQKASEVVIKLVRPTSYKEVKDGLKATFQKNRNRGIKEVLIVYNDGSLRRYTQPVF